MIFRIFPSINASSLSIQHAFLMTSQKVYEVMMGLFHLYSLLDKSHETLWLIAKEDQQPISKQTFAWLPDSGNFNQTSIKQEST